jgi:hypothetical protein
MKTAEIRASTAEGSRLSRVVCHETDIASGFSRFAPSRVGITTAIPGIPGGFLGAAALLLRGTAVAVTPPRLVDAARRAWSTTSAEGDDR